MTSVEKLNSTGKAWDILYFDSLTKVVFDGKTYFFKRETDTYPVAAFVDLVYKLSELVKAYSVDPPENKDTRKTYTITVKKRRKQNEQRSISP